jgi:hypothetical protein
MPTGVLTTDLLRARFLPVAYQAPPPPPPLPPPPEKPPEKPPPLPLDDGGVKAPASADSMPTKAFWVWPPP